MRQTIEQLLTAWDKKLDRSLIRILDARESRRQFLLQLLAAPVALSSISFSVQAGESAKQKLDTTWLTIQSTQQHLLPSDDHSPGAKDIGALKFLQLVLSLPDIDNEEKQFILDGAKWLNDISRTAYQQEFFKLKEQQKEDVLQRVSQSNSGDRWLSLLLLYILEALLADPVYGGNTNQAGWKWLQHTPGFPSPPVSKRYFEL